VTSAPDVRTDQGLGRRVVMGALWNSVGVMVLRVGGVVVGVVAARLLDPEAFGVYAISLVVFTLIGQVAELGLHSAMLRAGRDEFDTVAATALTLALVSYSILAVGLVLLAGPVAAMFGTPEAAPTMRVLALCVFLGAPACVPTAELRRDFRMAVQSVIEMVAFSVSTVVLVVLAVDGHGAMSLAWSRVIGQVIIVVGLQLVVSRRYWPGFRREEALNILRLGLPLVGATLVGTLIAGVNVFFMARTVGPAGVGLFNLGETVAAWPVGLFLPVLLNVGLPLFAQIRDDTTLVRDVFTRCIELIAWSFLPVAVLLSVLAPALVVTLYGGRWAGAAVVVQVLAFCKLGEIICRLCVDVAVAGGYTRRYLVVQAAWLGAQLPAVWWASRYGMREVALANLLVMALVVLPAHLALVRPLVGTATHRVFLTSGVPAAAALLAGMGAGLVARGADESWFALVVGGLVGGTTYLALTARWVRTALARARELRDMQGSWG
jgi:lipopolysaccharide exporter